MKTRWLIPLALAVVLLWLTRPSAPGFTRLPTGNRPMPAWTMLDLAGQPVASTNFAGQILVLNFWATWCPPCVAEIPDLKAFQAAHSTQRVVVIGASIDEGGSAKVKSFVERNGLNYPVLLADLTVQDLFGGVSGVPTTFLVNREGRLVTRYLGPVTAEELTQAIAPLLATPANPSR
jgi:thiol-disulfide isomerase/thioredoxin